MGTAVRLNDKLVHTAKSYAILENRSTSKQIEHWAKVGRIAEENPDLSYNIIKEMLLGLADIKMGRVTAYTPN